jgi:hypothetical protein
MTMRLRKYRRRLLLIALVALALLPALACRAEPPSRAASAVSPVSQTPRAEKLHLGKIEVSRLALDRAVRQPDAAGAPKDWTEAYLVRLEMERPSFWNELVRLYVGDWQVPEYGGWQRGIYFKVYDPALLTRLNGGELRYRIGSGQPQSFGRRLEVPPLDRLPRLREADLFHRKQ